LFRVGQIDPFLDQSPVPVEKNRPWWHLSHLRCSGWTISGHPRFIGFDVAGEQVEDHDILPRKHRA
jgi:hypothetical protein